MSTHSSHATKVQHMLFTCFFCFGLLRSQCWHFFHPYMEGSNLLALLGQHIPPFYIHHQKVRSFKLDRTLAKRSQDQMAAHTDKRLESVRLFSSDAVCLRSVQPLCLIESAEKAFSCFVLFEYA